MKPIRALLGALLFAAVARQGLALPTMIRLGYPNCVSCHIAPQGAGLLNLYGRSIDRAQSLIGGEYQPSEAGWVKALNWNGRITQDFRTVMQQQDVSTDGRPGSQLFRSRAMYRNATELGKGFRFTATITGENMNAPRPPLAYDSATNPATVFVNTALISYRASKGLEFSIGRDQLPTGINLPDLGLFVRSRNRQGYYDSPTQAKAFFWGKRYLVSPYFYGPGGNEQTGMHETGEGLLAEFDLFGRRKTVAGMNLLRGTATNGDRTLIGPYARLGFGKWGILAEHDITNRSLKTGALATFQQSASYGQLFWAVREWLVPSLIVERLRVERPYLERIDAIKLDLSARLTPQITIGVGPRLQHDRLTGRMAQSIVFQLAVKSVH